MKPAYKVVYINYILKLKKLQRYGNYKSLLSINTLIWGWTILAIIICILLSRAMGV